MQNIRFGVTTTLQSEFDEEKSNISKPETVCTQKLTVLKRNKPKVTVLPSGAMSTVKTFILRIRIHYDYFDDKEFCLNDCKPCELMKLNNAPNNFIIMCTQMILN